MKNPKTILKASTYECPQHGKYQDFPEANFGCPECAKEREEDNPFEEKRPS